MEAPNYLEENLAILQKILPQVALLLRALSCRRVSPSRTREGEENLCILLRKGEESSSFYAHSNYSAQEEAREWFASLQKETFQVLYVYGVGLGYALESAREWLESSVDHYLVFLEDDPEVLYRLMERENGRKILLHKQVQLHFFERVDRAEGMFQWILWFFILTTVEVSALPSYMRKKRENYQMLSSKLLHEHVRMGNLAQEYLGMSRSFYRNFYSNLLFLGDSYRGSALFGKFSGIPAIICGAGPSLDQNVEQLAALTERALIFAGSSSLNVLNHHEISPHFSAGIDPNPMQYQRYLTNSSYEVPFFYRQRLFHEAFQLVRGPKLYIHGTGGYSISSWIERELEMPADYQLDEGFNVVNFCTEIAHFLGCSPILFVGMDLAYTQMRSYAGGVVSDTEVDEQAIQKARSSFEGSAFLRPDIYGNSVYTLWKWISESEWIGNHAKNHPEHLYLNVTEGGLGFPGVANLSLKEATALHLSHFYPLTEYVHREVEGAKITHIRRDRLHSILEKIEGSLKSCSLLCHSLLRETEKMERRLNRGELVPDNLKSSQAVLHETELESEWAFRHILSDINAVRNKVYRRRHSQIVHDHRVASERERQRKKLNLYAEKITFLEKSAQANREILLQAIGLKH